MAEYKSSFILNDKVSPALKAIVTNCRKMDRDLGRANKSLEIMRKKFENIGRLGDKIKNIGKGLTVGVTLPVVAMGGAMVKAAADIEAMQQQLSTMLGSEEEGVKMFDKIKTMAAKTPFETKDLMAATNTMLSFGIAQEKVLPIMNQLGDISGGNADRFQSLALAFSQVSSAGKLQGQDLLQMINAGFNPLEAIAKRTGKSVGYWKEQMSKGKVTVNMVEQAMKDATSEGGRFYKMMEKQSTTALGQWSTFQDNLNMLLADFGKIILPTAIKALQKLSSTLEWFNSLSPGAKRTILVIGGISALIGPLLIGIGGLITSVASLNVVLIACGTTLPKAATALKGFATASAAALGPYLALMAATAAATWAVLKVIELLIKAITALNAKKIGGKQLNLSSDKVLGYLSQQREEMGAKAFNKMYDRSAQKAVENYNKTHNIDNSTSNVNSGNTTTNYYYSTLADRPMYFNPAYATPRN